MGLGKFLGKVANIVGPLAPLVGIVNPALGIALSTTAAGFARPAPMPSAAAPSSFVPQVMSVPSIEALTGVPSFLPSMATAAEAAVPVAAAGGVILGLTRTLAVTIAKLAGRLGITVMGVAGLSRIGSRIWRSLFTFARRHPNISVLSMLTALGLTIEEASEFIAWGSTKRRRRRGGISGRDMRIARRTIRRISGFQHDLAHIRAHAGGFRRGALRRGGGVSVVRAG